MEGVVTDVEDPENNNKNPEPDGKSEGNFKADVNSSEPHNENKEGGTERIDGNLDEKTSSNTESEEKDTSQTEARGKSSEGSDDSVSVKKSQPQQRAENKEFFNVLGIYGDQLAVPNVYNIHVNKDMIMNQGQSLPGYNQIAPEKQDSSFVPKNEINRINFVFDSHELFQPSLEKLKKHRAIIIQGPVDIGKRAAAIKLALALDSDLPIRELSPDVNLYTQLQGIKPEQGSVYIVTNLLSSRMGEITEKPARDIISWVETNQVYLVITTTAKVSYNIDIPTINWKLPNNPKSEILASHLEFGGILDPTQIECILEIIEQKKTLDKQMPPRQIFRLSEKILYAFETDPSIECSNKEELIAHVHPILDGFTQDLDELIEPWLFDVWDDLDEVTFRIALAVFNGTNYEDIYAAGKYLLKLVKPPTRNKDGEIIKEDNEIIEPFNPQKVARLRLKRAGAKRVSRIVVSEYSTSATIEVVELENSKFTSQTLRFIWREIIDWREPLLDWLSVYSIHRSFGLKIRAAAAISSLAGVEFDVIVKRIFKPWALDNLENSNYRRKVYQALTNTLGVSVWDDNQQENIMGLLTDWVDNNNIFVKWAAARCYSSVGLRYPKTAIKQWQKMLSKMDKISLELTDEMALRFVMTSDKGYIQDFMNTINMQRRFYQSVVDAIMNLFYRAIEFPNRLQPVFEQALEALYDWTLEEEEDKKKNPLTLLLFILIMYIRVPDENNNKEEDWPPAVLFIVNTQKDSSYRRIVAEMLHRTLNQHDDDLREKAFSELKLWVKLAGEQEWVKQALIVLISEIFILPELNPRFPNRLKRHLSIWSRNRKEPLEVAGEIYQTLNL